jgi:dimethylhistidine N-methyltransferase
VVFFPGSTIGNFSDAETDDFLAHVAETAGPGGGLLLGADQWKNADTLRRAYDDEEGVTAAFNLNLLARINRELGGTFRLDAFAHEARINAAERRVEMHLVSRGAQTVEVCGRTVSFRDGETIHTENSAKYGPDDLAARAAAAGFARTHRWTDPQGWFAVEFYTLP